VRESDIAQPLECSNVATASLTSGNIRRGPVWNSSGSSSTIRYWLKLKAPAPPGKSHRRVDAVDAGGNLVHVGAGLRLVIMRTSFGHAGTCADWRTGCPPFWISASTVRKRIDEHLRRRRQRAIAQEEHTVRRAQHRGIDVQEDQVSGRDVASQHAGRTRRQGIAIPRDQAGDGRCIHDDLGNEVGRAGGAHDQRAVAKEAAAAGAPRSTLVASG